MKKGNQNVRRLSLFFTLALAVTILFGSCATKVRFNPSTLVPAAEGNVKIKKDENKNYSISIKISNLAEPQRLSPSRDVYVVWIETKRDGIKNLGQLKSSKGLFSNALEGSLDAVTPFEPVKVFITAEESASLEHPGTQTVLQTREFG